MKISKQNNNVTLIFEVTKFYYILTKKDNYTNVLKKSKIAIIIYYILLFKKIYKICTLKKIQIDFFLVYILE